MLCLLSHFWIDISPPLATTTSIRAISPWQGEIPRVYDMTCGDTVCPPDSFCLTDYESGGSRCHCNLGHGGDSCSEGKKVKHSYIWTIYRRKKSLLNCWFKEYWTQAFTYNVAKDMTIYLTIWQQTEVTLFCFKLGRKNKIIWIC